MEPVLPITDLTALHLAVIAPADGLMFERLSLAASNWLPPNTYSDR